jgi:serine/threonine protein kinase
MTPASAVDVAEHFASIGPLSVSRPISSPPPAALEQRYRVMGEYLLLERIAAGGMGEVWLAKRKTDDGAFGDLRALKFLHKEHAAAPDVVAMFLEEARLASRLDHASVARLYELGRDEDTYYIAMEHLFGRDLLAVLRRARDRGIAIPPALVGLIGLKVAEALDAAHHATDEDGERLEIVHRDVSPQNVVLGFDGRVKLIDFGIARAALSAPSDPVAMVRGKLGYVSPEQAQGLPVDHKSDQFSLGICLWELLVLRPLFRRQSDSATLDDVIRARVPPVRSKLPSCPVELAAIVEKMLQKDPEQRFSDAAALTAALNSFLGRLPQKPERQDLVSFVRKLFEDDYNRDKMRLDALELVGREARPSSGDVTPSRGVPAAIARSLASDSLFDDDDPHEQATMIFPDAGPLARRAEREVFFRRDSVPQERTSRPSDPSTRGPVHATFRPGRAGAAEVWRPPASDLIESINAFEDPELAEERDEASFEVAGPFHGRDLSSFEAAPPTPVPETARRPSSRPPPSDLPTKTELERLSGPRLRPPPVPRELIPSEPRPSSPPDRAPTPTAPPPADRREPTAPVTTPTRKLASIPPGPDLPSDLPDHAPRGATRSIVVLLLALAAIAAATYAAFHYLEL